MSYEYKEEILLDIGPEPNCNYESESNRYYDKIDELDRVYLQAAKADEYEVKAKAFDEIKVYMQSAEDKLCDEEYFNEDVYEEYYGIIESVIEHHSENESGESDD